MASSAWRAPPTIANLGPGFDVLGVAIAPVNQHSLGDIVTATATDKFYGVRLTEIDPNQDGLSLEGNVVEVVGRQVVEKAEYTGGIELKLQKNMRIGTGMGSSASSSVAAALAVNDVLPVPYKRTDAVILGAVVAGEAAAIKKKKGHADNVFAALCGGFVYVHDENGTFRPRKIASGFSELYLVAVHPDIIVNTGEARDALAKAPYDTGRLVEASRFVACGNQSMISVDSIVKLGGKAADVVEYLEGFDMLIASIKAGNVRQLGRAMMSDRIVTPARAEFIPGYRDAKESALKAGACGFTIGGSGPTVVSVTDNLNIAYAIGEATQSAFRRQGIESRLHVCIVDAHGAQRAAV